MSHELEIFTDGACIGNPGPGGWAYLIRKDGSEVTHCGSEPNTTNQRMELLAAIIALESLHNPSKVILTSDSQYLIKGMTEWIINWKRNGWRSANKKPVKNQDIWLRLEAAAERHEVEWAWVRGHDDSAENQMVDKLAVQAALDRSKKPLFVS
jgi:ribonuclease HI